METRCAARCAALLAFAAAGALPAHAAAERADHEVPIGQNFSPTEITVIGLGAAAGSFLTVVGPETFGYPIESMGAPDPQSVDYRFSVWSNPDAAAGERWLGGAPDLLGYAAPIGMFAYYGGATLAAESGWIGQEHTRFHELLAFGGAFSFTQLSVALLKLTVGRRRPYAARPDLIADAFNVKEREQRLSFPSGHSAMTAVSASFLFFQLSDDLVYGDLRNRNAWTRYSLGYALPLAGALGATWLVMYSRIRDQKHWLSDTVTGALIGAGFSAYFYARHFDSEGVPLRRRDRPDIGPTQASALIAPPRPCPRPSNSAAPSK